MLRLAYHNLRARPGRTLLTALAIALGVAMILASRIVSAAVERAAGDERVGRLAGADLEVTTTNDALLRDGLAGELSGRPEVDLAAPVYRRLEGAFHSSGEMIALSGSYPFTGTGLLLLGVDPARLLTPYTLAAGEVFSSPDAAEVLLPRLWAEQRGVGVGETVTLTTGMRSRPYTVVGWLEPTQQEQFSGQPTAWLPLAVMQAGFDTPGVATSILLRLRAGTRPDPARERLQADLGGLYLVTSAGGGSGTRAILNVVTATALPFTGLAVLLAGSFLVYNAFAIALSQRRREMGQLRTLGMTRGQVLRQVLLEALLVALLGSGLGLLLGLVLGRGMMEVFIGFLQGGTVPEVTVPLDGLLLALGAGVLVTLAVSWNLARQAGRVHPLQALRAEGPGRQGRDWIMRWGWVISLAFGALFFAVNAWALQSLQRATTLDMVGVLLLPPFIWVGVGLGLLPLGVGAVLWLFERTLARRSAAARLAAGSLARQRTRAMLTTATLTIGLMLVTAIAGITLVQKAFFRGELLPLFSADFMLVRPSPTSSFAERVSLLSMPPPSPALQADLDALSLEAEVLYLANIQLPGYGSGPALDNGFALSLDIVRDSAAFQPQEGSWAEADAFFAQGPALSLPEMAARRLDLHPGDTVEIETLQGKVLFRVAFVGGPLPMVTREVGERYFHSYPFLILVRVPPGGDREALEGRLQALVREHTLALTADPGDEFTSVIDQMFDTILVLFAGLTSIAGLVAGLGMANTLIASVIERRREIGVLRAVGMTRRQVRGLVVWEAGLLGLTGAVVGTLTGLALTLTFGSLIDAFGRAIGFGVIFEHLLQVPLPWAVVGAALVAGPAMAMLAGLYPAARAAAVDPAEAMRD